MFRHFIHTAILIVTAIFFVSCGGSGGGGHNPSTYAVAYDGNGSTGGSVPVDSNAYEAGQTVTVPGNDGNLVKPGYTFAGWNTQADGSGSSYGQAQTFAMGSADVTLYAKWTLNPTYAVTYHGNGSTGGNVPVDSTRYEVGQTVTVLGNTGNLVRAGHTFAGWSMQADGSGTTYVQNNSFQMAAADVVFYAKWTANPTYTVTYSGNDSTGGEVPVDSNHYEASQTVTVIGNTGNLVKTGYTFSGWNTQADGSGTTYAQNNSFQIATANVTLYATWTANPTYSIVYDGNGNTGGIVPVDTTGYEAGNTVTVDDNSGNLVKTSHTFVGWNTQSDGGGTTYAQGATFPMPPADTTLFAKWSANPTYTVMYDGNGYTSGNVPDGPAQYETGQTVTVLGNTGNLARTSFTFSGWNTRGDGTGTAYTDGAMFTMGSADVTLYAQWAAPVCGNGVVEAGEECDGSAGCSASCQLTASCTDGVKNGTETDVDCGGDCPACASCAGAADGTACDDGDACTTSDTCQSGVCVTGTPVDCDDGVACTVDVCSPLTGCVAMPNDAVCDDGQECTAEACDALTGCSQTHVESGAACAGGFCDGAGQCVLDLDADGFIPPLDCDDSRAAVNPSAVETCNSVDDDCDTVVDEDC